MAPTGVSTWRQHASPYHSMELSLVTGRRRAKPCGLRNSIRFRTSQRRLFGLPFWEIKPRCIHQVHLSALLLSIRSCYIDSSPHAKNWDWFAGGSIRPGPLHLAGRAGLCPCERATRPTHPRGIRGVLGLVSLALAAPQRSKPGHSGAAVQRKGYRKEKRHPQTFRLQLSSTTDVLAPESACTENVSSHGMRVRTVRFWTPGTQALIKSPVRELWAGARIVYCHSRSSNSFALGLELLTASQEDKI